MSAITFSRCLRFFIFCAAMVFVVCLPTYAAAPQVETKQNAERIPCYDVYELTLLHTLDAAYTAADDGVVISAVFTAPSGKRYSAGGFRYAVDAWKVRFAPMEAGTWRWTVSYSEGKGACTTNGKFTAIPSQNSGFLRVHPRNPCRLMTEADGKAFYPLGFNNPYTCADDFLHAATNAGTNMERLFGGVGGSNDFFSEGNGAIHFMKAFNVNNSGMNSYNLNSGVEADKFVMALHRAGIKMQMAFFPWAPITFDVNDPQTKQALLNYHQYLINRYGAYADVWELCNETGNIPQAYLDTICNYIHAHDPYHHLVTVSFDQQQDNQEGIDLFSGWHPYFGDDDLRLDASLAKGITELRNQYRKPLLFGEGGNYPPAGNYSPLRYRLQILDRVFRGVRDFILGYQPEVAHLLHEPVYRLRGTGIVKDIARFQRRPGPGGGAHHADRDPGSGDALLRAGQRQ